MSLISSDNTKVSKPIANEKREGTYGHCVELFSCHNNGDLWARFGSITSAHVEMLSEAWILSYSLLHHIECQKAFFHSLSPIGRSKPLKLKRDAIIHET